MTDPNGIRRRSALHQAAGITLRHFLRTVAAYNPPGNTKHFRLEFQNLQPRIISRSYDQDWLKSLRQEDPKAYRRIEEDKLINKAFFQILLATTGGGQPSDSDLRRLRQGLNRDVEEVGFFPRRFSPAGGGPYLPAKLEAIRAGAELLLRYLNLAHHYGAVHTVCSKCGSLMTKGRGGKKFCSPECRKEAWSYASKPDYFKSKQRERLRGVQLSCSAVVRRPSAH
jgi:hypothetical protein